MKTRGDLPSERPNGFSIIEGLIASFALVVAFLGLSKSILGSLNLEQKNRETAIATNAARQLLEELSSVDFETVFQRYNAIESDDPDSRSPGATFQVEGLRRPDGSNGTVGEIRFPTQSGKPGVLTENSGPEFEELPRDINLNGSTGDEDVTADAALIPVIVRVEWQGVSGPGVLQIKTILVPWS